MELENFSPNDISQIVHKKTSVFRTYSGCLWIPNMFGIRMVQTHTVKECFQFWIPSEYQTIEFKIQMNTKQLDRILKSVYFATTCWYPWRYSCSKVGTTTWRLFQDDSSSRLSTGGAGSRHSGIKTMKDNGSFESDKSLSKWVTIASMSSSQNGGLASKDPETGLKSRIGLFRVNKTLMKQSTIFRKR